ncbi:aldose epimerase family protein [Vagococcus fessus]|uniref:Aldose 1-epimerase n=1 Tax=Vagococcus fessus TaxID=120370 RepID=A0A430A7R8_9ENTE|nr:aldose epimerase family protein [Vagococcus fessus]RSU03119.1 hypothetical protein CBF31_05215 [Vagococcus fessus]
MTNTIKVKKSSNTVLEFITIERDGRELTTVNYGARLTSFCVPDCHGKLTDIVLGFDYEEDVLKDQACFGATVGPVAGRIKEGSWNGYNFSKGENGHTLHSGEKGWQNRIWESSLLEQADYTGVSYRLMDKEAVGFESDFDARVDYLLYDEGRLEMVYYVKPSGTTLLNPTNHSYFNLSGNGLETVGTHYLTIESEQVLVTDDELIPTGEFKNVKGTAFDFTNPRLLETSLKQLDTGLDTTFVLKQEVEGPSLRLFHPQTGIELSVETERKALVIYSSGGIAETAMMHGSPMKEYRGLAIEPQEHPDACHHEEFPSIIAEEGQEKIYRTTYRTAVRK